MSDDVRARRSCPWIARPVRRRIRKAASHVQGHRRAQPEAAAGFFRALSGRRPPAARSSASHPDLHGLHGQNAGRPEQARPGPDGTVATVYAALAGNHAATDGTERRAGRRAGAWRQTLQRSRLEGRGRVRLPEAILPAHGTLAAGHGEGCRRRRRQDRPENRVLYPPVRRCAVAVQLRPHQSAGREGHRREQGREPAQRPAQPADRPRARQGQARDPADRHERLQGRRECRHLARQGGLPEPVDAAHPVRAAHCRSPRDAAADRAAVDQQVLHPRPQAAELVHQVGDRGGLHGVRHLLGQSGREAHARWSSRTT